jgi:hypothetical protein
MSDKHVNIYVGEFYQGDSLHNIAVDESTSDVEKFNVFLDAFFEIKMDTSQVYFGGLKKASPLIVTGNGEDVPLLLNFYGDIASDSDTLVLESFFNQKGSPIKDYQIYHLFDPATHEFFYKGTKLEVDTVGNVLFSKVPKGLPFVQLEARRKG